MLAGAAVPSLASADLPRTYEVQRIDSPSAGSNDTFGFGLVNGGDLNADGEDDLLVAEGTRILNDGTGAEDGAVLVVSGADGSVIRTIAAPEPDAGCSTSPTAADRCAAFGFYVGRIGSNQAAAPFTDLGSCPGGNTDADPFCDAATVGAPDGTPDIVASALHVDRASTDAADGTAEDIGRVYVIDGKTFSVLKALDMPQADVDDMADETEQLAAANPATPVRPWFGRTVLNPAGQPPCAGNYGIGPCTATPIEVQRGDLDKGGSPDIVVGSSAYKYDEAEGNAPPSCGDNGPGGMNDLCIRSGRVYMYRGEDIVGTDPSAALDAPGWNVQNPFAQEDDPNTLVVNQLELFGHSVAPVGDLGRCTAPVSPGASCPPANISGTADGAPEVLVSEFRADYPLSGPDNQENFDIGVNLVLDGATGRIVRVYRHPDPDPGSIFGFTIYNQPAFGDMGNTPLPDLFVPAGGQDTDANRGEGVGFLMNGANVVSGNTTDLQRFRDPTPEVGGSFGTTAAGVGNLVGDARNELLIGAFSTHNPPQNDQTISDVHFFDPITGAVLQTVPDPDQQKVSNFGLGVQPLGDLNDDGFLDFAVGAGRYDGSSVDQGRVYIFKSDNSPAPPEPPEPEPPAGAQGPAGPRGPATPGAPTATTAGRSVELIVGRSSVRPRGRVRVRGILDAFANERACRRGETVLLQARRPRALRYRTIRRRKTGTRGTFRTVVQPRRTLVYRARVARTSECDGAVSNRQRVAVRR